MTSRKKHILFIVLFLTLSVAVGSLYLFRCGKIDKSYVQKPVRLENISFSGATVYYPKEVFEVPTSLSLSVAMNDKYVPEGIVAYKDYLLRGTLAQRPHNSDPISMGMKIEIDYSDIDTAKCEINEKDFVIYQYHPHNIDVSPLPTEINQTTKIASANIATFPVVENEQVNSLERWSYFTLGNKQTRFLAGGCGDEATLYLENNKIYNTAAGYIVPYGSGDDAKQTKISGAAGLGTTMPFNLGTQNIYELQISAYTSDLPLNRIETLKYGYELSVEEAVMVKAGEKVVTRKTDSTKKHHVIEVEGPDYSAVRVAKLSSFKTGEKNNIYYVIEAEVPTDTHSDEYKTVKEYVLNKADAMEFTNPTGF